MTLQLKPRSLSKPAIPRFAIRVVSFFVIGGCGVLSALSSELPADPTQCVVLQGTSIQGGMLWGQTSASAEIRFGDRRVPVLPDGQFLLGLGRDMPASVELVVEDEATCRQIVAVAARDYRVQRIEGVPQQTVTPSEEHLERIRAERDKVRAAKSRRLPNTDGLLAVQQGFLWPVTGRISGVYGSQRIYNGTPGTPHYGVDVARPKGTPVLAPAAGEVTLAEPDLFYSGGTVILDHGYGFSSSFLHLSEVSVSVGDRLAPGDLIGAIGATGRATGPHLDWRMSWFNQRIDPQLLVPPMPE
jgi:hypothetical protein